MTNINWLKESNEYVFDEIFVNNLYGVLPSEIAGKLVLDIGANVGIFSIMCLELGAEAVVAYEPEPDNWTKLLSNRSRYGKELEFSAYNEALTGDGRRVSMSGTGGQAHLGGPGEIHSVTLSAALAQAIRRHDNSFGGAVLKMDCEGAEYEILFNASGDTIRQFDTIYLEGHGEMLHILKSYIRFLGFRQDREIPLFAWDVNDLGQKINERRLDVEIMKFTKK